MGQQLPARSSTDLLSDELLMFEVVRDGRTGPLLEGLIPHLEFKEAIQA